MAHLKFSSMIYFLNMVTFHSYVKKKNRVTREHGDQWQGKLGVNEPSIMVIFGTYTDTTMAILIWLFQWEISWEYTKHNRDTNGIEVANLIWSLGACLKMGNLTLTNKQSWYLRDNCDVVNLEFDNSSRLTRNGLSTFGIVQPQWLTKMLI